MLVMKRAYNVLCLRIFGAIFSLIGQLLVTWMLDLNSAGAFFLGLNCLLLTSAISKLGLDQVLV
jgi:hypothetical protein